MIGLAYIDADSNLSFRSKEFLDNNPGFISDNYEFIMKAWHFDTDNLSKMQDMFRSFMTLKLTTPIVRGFAESIGFDINTLKQKA